MSRLLSYINEGKKLTDPMIGYGIDPSDVKPLAKYVESWLIRKNIKYQRIEDYHVTISQIFGTYEKDELVRAVHDIEPVDLYPIGLTMLRGKRVPKDFIVLEFKPSPQFIQSVREISDYYKTFKFPKIAPHVSLFMIEQGAMDDELFEAIKQGAPQVHTVKTEDVELWNARHEKEYEA